MKTTSEIFNTIFSSSLTKEKIEDFIIHGNIVKTKEDNSRKLLVGSTFGDFTVEEVTDNSNIESPTVSFKIGYPVNKLTELIFNGRSVDQSVIIILGNNEDNIGINITKILSM